MWFCKFSNDGTKLATGSKDTTVIIWQVDPVSVEEFPNEHTHTHTHEPLKNPPAEMQQTGLSRFYFEIFIVQFDISSKPLVVIFYASAGAL